MLNYCLRGDPKVNLVLADEFKLQVDAEMYSQIPDYDDPHRIDSPHGHGLAAISKRIYVIFYKRFLLNDNISKKLFRKLEKRRI